MSGSLHAAERRNGKAVVRTSDRLRRFLVLGGLAASAALAACSAAPPAPTPPSASPPAPSAAEPPAHVEPVPAVARIPDIPILTGMAPTELVAVLGEPDFRRSEPPAELWQYRSADCVLDVFLYADSGGSYRVLRSATRDRHVTLPTVASCTAAFDRQSRQSGL